MRHVLGRFTSFCAGSLLVLVPLAIAGADDSQTTPKAKVSASTSKAAKGRARSGKAEKNDDQNAPEINLLTAMRDGSVSVQAEGRGDGRMTLSVTNNTRRQLRVVLPPGIIAQGCHRPVRWHGWHGRWHGRHGRWRHDGRRHGRWYGRRYGRHGRHGMGGGGGGMGGGMGGMGSMGRSSGTMPATMGMMMLARMIMYFCGDPDSWDMRSLMIGMMGGMGMMGGGGGMMGGMGGGMMGGMGGGMRSVPRDAAAVGTAQSRPDAAFADAAGEHHPAGSRAAACDSPRRTSRCGSWVTSPRSTTMPQVQKALRRLAADKAPTSLSQLVMWNVAAGLDWNTIAQLSQRLVQSPRADAGQGFRGSSRHAAGRRDRACCSSWSPADEASKAMAAELSKALQGKSVLGLVGPGQ